MESEEMSSQQSPVEPRMIQERVGRQLDDFQFTDERRKADSSLAF
jgi:hypothetical protein